MPDQQENLKSLSQIFQDSICFEVPDYQRGYSWDNKQLDDLWEDLENLNESRYHYMGMFTFSKNEKSYEIVDGQQRMTTLIILINELLAQIKGGISGGMSVQQYKRKYLYDKPYGTIAFKYKFQYSADNPSDMYFKTVILEQEETGASFQPQDTLYTRNLLNAKKYFKAKIEKLEPDKLAELFLKVTERLKFNEYQINDANDVYVVYVVFETMNNRGKELSTLELLKNRLIYLSTLYSYLEPENTNVKTLREDINNAWKTIYEYLGKSSEKTLSDDVLLRDHWIMYFRYDRSASKVFRKDLLSDYFTAKKVFSGDLKIDEIDKYVRNLQRSVFHWFKINCPCEVKMPDDEKEWLIRLNRVGLGCFKPLLMAAYWNCYNDMSGLIKACERFRFLVMIVSERRSNTGDSYFYRMANDYFKSGQKKDLTAEVAQQTKSWIDLSSFVKNAEDRYKKNAGFYSWTGIRYFLYEYEKSLQSGADGKVDWKIFENNQKNKITIEHIFPQTADDPYWKQRFDNSVLLHSIGNLLLLSRSKNSSLQNDSFDKKKQTKLDEGYYGYDTGSYSEIVVSKEVEWTPETIEKRGRLLIKFLKTHWDIDYEFTDDEINKLLNLGGNESEQSCDEQCDEPGMILENEDETVI